MCCVHFPCTWVVPHSDYPTLETDFWSQVYLVDCQTDLNPNTEQILQSPAWAIDLGPTPTPRKSSHSTCACKLNSLNIGPLLGGCRFRARIWSILREIIASKRRFDLVTRFFHHYLCTQNSPRGLHSVDYELCECDVRWQAFLDSPQNTFRPICPGNVRPVQKRRLGSSVDLNSYGLWRPQLPTLVRWDEAIRQVQRELTRQVYGYSQFN